MPISFQIKSRWTAAVMFTCEIEVTEDTPFRIQLGLAVRKAYEAGAVLRGAVLSDADLRGAVLRDAVLSGADLSGADLSDADLRGAVLRDAVLRDADLSDADLSDADLRGAVLRDAVLSGADLSGADLSGADLSGADLSGADLRGADLSDEKVSRVIAVAQRLDGYTFHAFELMAGGVKIKAGCRWFSSAEYRAHIANEYPGSSKATETLAILDFIDRRANEMGVAAATEAKAEGAQ